MSQPNLKIFKLETGLDGVGDTKANPHSGNELVAELLKRQDVVLDELDQLNHRIEAMISTLAVARHSDAA